MSIIDKELVFNTSGSTTGKYGLTSGTITGALIDLGEGGDAIGQELTLHSLLTTKVTAGGTVQVKVKSGTAGTAMNDLVLSPVTSITSGTSAGTNIFTVRIPGGVQRYLSVDVIGSTALSGGTMTIFATKEL